MTAWAARAAKSGAGRRAALLLLLALQGCAALRHTGHAAAPGAPAAGATEAQPDAAQTDPQAGMSADSRGAEAAAGDSADKSADKSADADASAAPLPCSCTDAKSKPKHRRKPKPEPKEAPPQLATAPAVAETPPGGVVDAHVAPMSVSVMSILGKRVKGPNGEDLGRVVDVLADASGRVRIAIIDFGGFLGVGNHRIAVDWPLLRFNPDGTDPSLLLSLSPEKLRTAPEYKDNPRPQTLMEVSPPVPAAVPTAAASAAEVKK